MSTRKRHRCGWAEGSSVMQEYHDTEWGVMQRDSRALWEMLMLEGFQAGLAWIVVLRKRDAFRAAFSNFIPQKVARYRETDVVRLLGNPNIIRSRAKIEATIGAAKIYCEMAKSGDDFGDLCWCFTQGKVLKGDGKHFPASSVLSERISKEFKRRGFKFVGPTIVYAWMQAVGIVNDHAATCFRRKQV
ncbi:MAG TPA: DNA-3-methyladenine glycosylase I [Steroidobacteraceae bacterium]